MSAQIQWPAGPPSSRFVVRPAGPDDADVLVQLFDASVAWLVARGFTAQWGATPLSQHPRSVAKCAEWAAGGGFHLCEVDGRPVAALVVGAATEYVPAATEPELYVVVLVGSHEPFARGAGAHLLAFADDEARRRGVHKLRVDCFAGNDGALIRFYERCGYRRTSTFCVGDWPGQVLERRLVT